MKRPLVALLFCLICLCKVGLAQTSAVHINILTSESRKMYVDFDNVVKVYVDGLDQKDVLVKCSKGFITKSPINDSLFIFKFSTANSSTTEITVSQQVNGQIKKRGTQVLTVKAITPELKFEKGRFKDANIK